MSLGTITFNFCTYIHKEVHIKTGLGLNKMELHLKYPTRIQHENLKKMEHKPSKNIKIIPTIAWDQTILEIPTLQQKPNLILSKNLDHCIKILSFFGYFPFSLDRNNGVASFKFLSFQALYSTLILFLSCIAFCTFFLVGSTFQEIYKRAKGHMNRVDYIVLVSEAYLGQVVFAALVLQSFLLRDKFVLFWNNLQNLLQEIGTFDSPRSMRSQMNKVLALFALSYFIIVTIMSYVSSGSPKRDVPLLNLVLICAWSLFVVSYYFTFIFCSLRIHTFIILFKELGARLRSSLNGKDTTEVYRTLAHFEQADQLFQEFKDLIGSKMLICVGKVCYSTFLIFRMVVLLLKLEGSGKKLYRALFGATLLYSGHLWGLLFLGVMCHHSEMVKNVVRN